MSEKDVSWNTQSRALRRAIVEMEINDIVAIEGVRLARELKRRVETMRALGRARRKDKSADTITDILDDNRKHKGSK